MEDENRTDLKDAMCIYGGSRCSFDGTIRFMQDTLQKTTTRIGSLQGDIYIQFSLILWALIT